MFDPSQNTTLANAVNSALADVATKQQSATDKKAAAVAAQEALTQADADLATAKKAAYDAAVAQQEYINSTVAELMPSGVAPA